MVRASIKFLSDGSDDRGARLVLAHGAGAPMDSPFMKGIARDLSERGIQVFRFEFPYMRKQRELGKRTRPDSSAVLMDAWRAVIGALGGGAGLFIGGKSMGGRIASMIADEAGVQGLVCLGYPFHPAGKPDKTRTSHLAELRTPTLIVQGTRDELGSRRDVDGYRLSSAIRVHWLEDGDHSFKPRKASGRSHPQALSEAVAAIVAFTGGTIGTGS
jgi:predicted alpha/beta-hydrolase family hydrolase